MSKNLLFLIFAFALSLLAGCASYDGGGYNDRGYYGHGEYPRGNCASADAVHGNSPACAD